MRMKLIAPMAALVLAATGASIAHAATITSTFDTGTEGWTFGTYNAVRGQPVTWDGVTQSLTKTHGFGEGVFLAPAAYRGDKSDYLGGSFSFDLSASAVDTGYRTRPAMVLIGKDNQFYFSRSSGYPATTLTHFEFDLTAANFYKGSPSGGAQTAVSSAEFAALMGDLREVGIWADWTGNVETNRLDNVSMAQGGVPEPATWALMIMGFGAAGAALRRRRPGYAVA